MTHSRYECFILVTPAIAPLWYDNTSLHWCKSVSEVNQTVLLNLICETQQQWRQGRCTNCKLDAVLSHSTSGKLLQHIRKTFNKVDTVTNAATFSNFSPIVNCTRGVKFSSNHFTWQLAHKNLKYLNNQLHMLEIPSHNLHHRHSILQIDLMLNGALGHYQFW